MPRDIMSEQQININFVKTVQKYPSLYNFELPSYSRKDISDQAWDEVSKIMNMTPSACRERWRNLRAVFMRTMKAPPKGTGKKKPYYLADVMQFVVPYMRPLAMAEAAKEKQKRLQAKDTKEANTKNPIEVEIEQIKVEQIDDGDSDDWGTFSVEEERDTSLLRKRSAQDEEPHPSMKVAKMAQPSSSTVTLDSDHIKSFLNSLLPELNEMNSVQFKNFKRRVLLLIDDIMSEIPASPRRHTDKSEYIM